MHDGGLDDSEEESEDKFEEEEEEEEEVEEEEEDDEEEEEDGDEEEDGEEEDEEDKEEEFQNQNEEDGEELEIPKAWLKFAGAGAAWPPGQHADATEADVAMGCMLHLLHLQSKKSLSGKALEAIVLMWKSLGQPWVKLLPTKAQSIRK